MTKRRIACLCLAVLLLMPMLLSGCGKEVEKPLAPYTANSRVRCEMDPDTAMATVENDKYILMWSEDTQRFALQIKETGEFFLSAPTEYGSSEDPSAPIKIGYVATETQANPTPLSGAADCLNQDNYSSEQIENGFRAVYSFDSARIAVTVEYLLREDGLEIRIPMDGLQEDNNRLCEIHLAPFVASVENGTDSYVMVPSGSGALIRAEDSVDLSKEVYAEDVYGTDLAEPITMQKYSRNQIYLPVFGTTNKATNTGMLGIVEGGEDCAVINYGNNGTYANVYASFNIRSNENVVYNDYGSNNQSSNRYSNSVTSCEYLSVRYIPLSEQKGDDITYNGMASTYREYLQARNFLTERPESVPGLSVNVMGGTQVTESFFGIPYMTDVATTTLTQTQAIASELKGLIGDKELLLSLIGYGEGGLANVTAGGGFKLSSEVGKNKDLNALVRFAKENGITLSMNYELSQFQSSGGGLRVGRDAAWGVSSLKATVNSYVLHTGLADSKGATWYLAGPQKLVPMMDKAIQNAKKMDIGSVSIGSLNSGMYSDFRNEGYAAMTGFSDTVEAMLNRCEDNAMKVVANGANAYVAVNADYVTEVPMHSARFNVFDEDIPFYALVFQGYMPLTSSSINLAVNPRDAYLQAIATGMTLQFTLCDTLHDAIQYDKDSAFASSRYSDWKDTIAAMVEESAPFYAKAGNQAIVRYENHGDVSVTEFENGLIVIVNYADEAVTYDGIELKANSFIYR